MTSSDGYAIPEPPNLDELRRQIIAQAPPPASDSAEVARLARSTLHTIRQDRIVPRAPELRVRLAGDGVPGHDIPVHSAAQILDAMQGAVTAVGSSLRKAKRAKPPKDATGRRMGVRRATELRLSPTIAQGSVIFHLEGRAEPEPKEYQLSNEGSESLVDVAVVELLRVLQQAQDDEGDTIGALTTRLQKLGAGVASKLNALAEQTSEKGIDLDLAHWSPSGDRSAALLKKRGADAIKEAVDRNRERTEQKTLIGRLNTVSDGADMCRITPEDGKPMRFSVDPEIGVAIGQLLGQEVTAEIETTIRWHIATGVEKRSHRLLSADRRDSPA